ncbi:MAG TPA: response regulator transcription factor [Thermoleophilia bacterium]|nr:response regulator transcription factor [Thermoleophilia bacterium]
MSDGATMPPRIRVMVVDDHELVRTGIRRSLELFDDLEVVAEVASGQAAVDRCADARPDVVLMDLVMPDLDGPEAAAEVLRRAPEAKVLALTSFSDPDLIGRTLRAGASGYVLKNVSAHELASAIRQTYAGIPTLAPEVTEVLVRAMTGPPPAGATLTEREREILSLLAEGLTNPEIADRLVVTRSTVKTHVSSILSKLGASSRAEVVAMAVRDHLI